MNEHNSQNSEVSYCGPIYTKMNSENFGINRKPEKPFFSVGCCLNLSLLAAHT